jgi:UMF1 family MFS transporter
MTDERSFKELATDRLIFSWSMYDWANRSFATTVMAGFFPIFFKQYWSYGTDVNVSTYQLGNANALSAAILAFLSPVLGAITDQGSSKKRLLVLFGVLGLVMTGSLSLVAKGDWPVAMVLYVLANIGFAGSNSFHDAILVFIAKPKEFDRVSALGFAFGYLGGGLLFTLNVIMTLRPSLFGLRDATQAVQVSFLTVALWWALFSVPILLFYKEDPRSHGQASMINMSKAAFRQIGRTFHEIRQAPNLLLFLIAYFFYIDGVNTIMRMAVDYGLSLGFSSQNLIVALLMTQFVAFPAAIVYGQLSHRIGTKLCLMISIGAYAAVTVYAYFMIHAWQFYFLAFVIGLFQGGIQALSRSVFAAMTPRSKAGEYFGFFNMLGRFSSMIGPILVGWVSLLSGDSRLSVLSLILLYAVGAVCLAFVRIDPITVAITD